MEKKWSKPINRNIKKYVFDRNSNCIIGITGRVGTGKSLTATAIGLDVDPKFEIKKYVVYSIQDLIYATISVLKFKGEYLSIDFFEKIDDVNEWLTENYEHISFSPGRVIVVDEAGHAAYVRQFWSAENKNLSKLLMLWRFLRMVVIFVVPEDMKFAESTLTRFLNLEILLKGVDKTGEFANAVVYEYIGWDWRKNKPIRRRVKGCRCGGFVHILKLDDKIINEYNSIAGRYKMEAIVDFAKEFKMTEKFKGDKKRNINEDVKYVREHSKEFQNRLGRMDRSLIQAKLGMSYHKAEQIKKLIENESNTKVIYTTKQS